MSQVPIPSLYIILHMALSEEGGRKGVLPIERARLILSRSILGLSSVRATIVLAELEAYGLVHIRNNKEVLLMQVNSRGLPFL